ncbi:hypothetical protein [Arthrobacter sp. SX1312]|uniref:hypothetical protein n=1 Tax=Arthrobacter sp. SX1312 TaxID=2058896 RepID=UPI000CE2FD50|nr:hypothetical protein [Arthrobacter sp. SX1312]
MADGGLPYLRALTLVSLILSVSAASHVLAAGHLPHLGVILLLGALLLVPVMLLTRRALSFRAALLAMGAGQLLLHTLFGMTAAPAVCRSSSAMPGHHAAFELACSPAMQDQLGAASGGLAMLLLHALATVILAVAVSRSDHALEFLRAWLRPLFVRPALAPPAPARRRPVQDVPAPVAPLSVHASVPTLRGPPRTSALPI